MSTCTLPRTQASKSLFVGLEDKLPAAASMFSGARAPESSSIPIARDRPHSLQHLNGQHSAHSTALDRLDVARRISLLPRR